MALKKLFLPVGLSFLLASLDAINRYALRM